MASEERFGYEWRKYHRLNPDYEIQFRRWLGPFGPDAFLGKKVLDAGCGMGRNSYWAFKYGAKELVAFDFDSRTVGAAKKNLSSFPNARIELKSIYDIPWQNEFDLVFCIGVIHHLENPQRAIEKLIEAVKSGGLLVIWVYGYEGNEWLVRFISPVRKYLTSHLPPAVLHVLAYILTLPFWLFLKVGEQKSPYLKQLSRFGFAHVHSIIFDQLLPSIARYYKKDEAYQLLSEDSRLRNTGITPCNQNSWTVYGYKS